MTPPPSPAVEGGAAAAGHGGRRRHVLLFPLPYQGHINPMLRLAGVLRARGFAVTVFHTHFNAPDAARHPEHRFVAVPDGMSGRPPPVSVGDVVKHIRALNAACEAAFRDRLAAVLAEYSRDAVACLVADAHLLRMLDMPVSELPPYRVRDLMHIGRDGHELMCELLARAVAAVKLSSGLILNTFDALEAHELAKLRRDLAVPVFDIGPLHRFSPAADGSLLHQDRSCLAWLDAQTAESVLYVSFGSLASMGARELVETAWGIAGSGVPFLWVVRPGLVRGRRAAPGEPTRLLPEGFEAATRRRGVVVAWAPQEEVLRHRAVGGFWTHNGWNSTTESLAEGVPMLCRPSFGDQMGNARYVEHVWKAGFEVVGGELERGAVEEAIRRLMAESDGGEMRARARELKKAAAEGKNDKT
uniref:UDP-glycosyltransferases domain-containing protein n=1 Tax=Oryza rufipogon TaxID=4529 RepID=A0A0E0P3B8_ORYRU